MTLSEILQKCDHTLLERTATWENIKETLDDAIYFGTATACIPSYFVREAKNYVGDRLKICTVIGFPNGYSNTEAKIAECRAALRDGADEIDTVVNLCQVKSERYDEVLAELKSLKTLCEDKILKVIIETCLLTEEEKIRLCHVVSESGADFIKTSTGFSTGGATAEDVKLLRENVAAQVKVKAAGGISSIADAELFLNLGADRLGTSRIVKIAKNESSADKY
jgi:deoxyribose-phosphate aldolase